MLGDELHRYMVSLQPSVILSYLKNHPKAARRGMHHTDEYGLDRETSSGDLEGELQELAPDEIQEILDIIGLILVKV